jgi:hypothetical protein
MNIGLGHTLKCLAALIGTPLVTYLLATHFNTPEMATELLTLGAILLGGKWMTSIDREESLRQIRTRKH